jgi:hypothetical protein
MLTNLRDDLKLGLRALRHDRGFALAAVLVDRPGRWRELALFSLVDQALLRMLPVRDPDRSFFWIGRARSSAKGGARAT